MRTVNRRGGTPSVRRGVAREGDVSFAELLKGETRCVKISLEARAPLVKRALGARATGGLQHRGAPTSLEE